MSKKERIRQIEFEIELINRTFSEKCEEFTSSINMLKQQLAEKTANEQTLFREMDKLRKKLNLDHQDKKDNIKETEERHLL